MTISSGRRNQQIESIRTRQISGKHNLLTGKSIKGCHKVKCIISHVLRNNSSAAHTNAVACASYKQRECVDESDKDDDDDDESGDSEIEESEDQPELFDQVILTRSGKLATTCKADS